MSSPSPTQMIDLPIPPGSQASDKLHNTNKQLTILNAQATQDSKYDPQPLPANTVTSVSGFISSSIGLEQGIAVIGILCIIYGIISK